MEVIVSSESVFYTIQGEGKYAGYPSIFLRLSVCNLKCSWKNDDGTITLCDTPHTSFSPEMIFTSIKELIKEISKYDCKHLVITGGEPYVQKSFPNLVSELSFLGYFITIETNGTIYKKTPADFISLSPKLSSSSAHEKYGKSHDKKRINYHALSQFLTNHECQFKFVVNSERDISEILEIRHNLVKEINLSNIESMVNDKIWLMPQGIEENQLQSKMQWLWDKCKEHKWKYSDRLHVRCYGHVKGV